MKTVQAMLAEADAAVPRISPEEAKSLIGRADVLFLDVREPAEVAASGKVAGALAVPRGLVEFRADPTYPLHDAAFDRAKTVVCYCASGGRSALVGKAQWAQDRAVAYAKQRHTFGQPLSDRQAIQWMIADSEIEIEQLRGLIYKAAWMLDQGRDARREVAMVKALAPVIAGSVADRAIQIHGAIGLAQQSRLIAIAGQARVGRIAEGTTETMKITIARAVLNRKA